jgi:hypothetical protein
MDNELNDVHSVSHEWVVVDEVAGPMQAEILRGLLEAQGLTVSVVMEGVGRVHGFFVGPLANNQILVPDDQAELALKILQDYYAGVFEQAESERAESNPSEELGGDGSAQGE